MNETVRNKTYSSNRSENYKKKEKR